MADEKILNAYTSKEDLTYFHGKEVERTAAEAAETLRQAKEYADGLADNYDAAGTAQTKVTELKEELTPTISAAQKAADDAQATADANTEAIAKLNGDAETEGSVAKQIADTKALIDADVEAVDAKADKNAEDIAAINDEETGILKQSKDYADSKDAAIQAAKDAADAAQADADALEQRMNTAEESIEAIQTDMGNVDDLQTTSKTVAGAINEVLTAVGTGGTASVVTITTDTTTEGALKSYTIKQGTTTVGVIDIPKDMVVEDGSVVTLTDGEVEGQAAGTYIKLVLANVAEPLYINVGTLVDIYKAAENATQVQLAIDSATREISATIVAGSITSTELADNAVTTVKIADANVTLAKLSAAVQASLAKADAAAPQTALDEEVTRAKAAEAKALEDANAYTDEQISEIDLSGIETNAADIDKIEASLAEGGATANAIADAKKAGTDASAAVTALEEGQVAENAAAIGTLQSDVAELQNVEWQSVGTEYIDSLFA